MVDFPADRYELVGTEFEQPYFLSLKDFLKKRKQQWVTIYPPWWDIFRAFRLTPVETVKVVLLGQDPYHGVDQAHGLSFSVPEGMPLPPSLKNIFHEIIDEYGGTMPKSWNLTFRAEQGVLLLNAMLTVEAGQPASHQQIWWQQFTDTVIHRLSEEKNGIVFLLWGAFAKSKRALIDTTKHIVLEAAHPSPFSARNGFFGCNHFRLTNEYLELQGRTPIQWLV